eukprot:UC4_evm6s1308
MAFHASDAGGGATALLGLGPELILTQYEEEIEGDVFAVDIESQTIVLRVPFQKAGGRCFEFRIISIPFIKKCTAIDCVDSTPLPKVCHVDLAKVEKRKAETMRNVLESAKQVGDGVTKEVQLLFNELHKAVQCTFYYPFVLVTFMLRCRNHFVIFTIFTFDYKKGCAWKGQCIILKDYANGSDVVISPPYTAESCVCNTEGDREAAALKRVRSVILPGVLERIG